MPGILELGMPEPSAIQMERKAADRAKKRAELLGRIERNPGKFTPALIHEMKGLDVPKPDWIPSADWMVAVEEFGPIHETMCYMAAFLVPTSVIAEKLGRSYTWTSGFLRSTDARAKIREVQDKHFGESPAEWIKKMILPEAVRVSLDIMKDESVKPGTRLNAAMDFMDRGLGKAPQVLDLQSSTLRDLLEKMDSLDRTMGGKVVVAEVVNPDDGAIEVKLVEKKDDTTDFVDRIVGDMYGEEVHLGEADGVSSHPGAPSQELIPYQPAITPLEESRPAERDQPAESPAGVEEDARGESDDV